MLNDLSKYSFINAKIRSKIGNIFTEDELTKFRKESKYYDLINLLVEKGYIDEQMISIDNSIENIEYVLNINLIKTFQEILSYINHKATKKFSSILLQKYEITNIKNILRLWHQKDNSMIDYIFDEPIVYNINYEAIFSSETIEELIDQLQHTPYYNILIKHIEEYKKTNSLFILETCLDRYFYELIFAHLKLLNKRDQEIIKKFFGFEIDIKNFLLMIRFKNYYNLDLNTFLKYLLPSGYRANKQMFQELYSKDEISFDLFNIFSSLPEYISKDMSEKLTSEVNLKNKMLLIHDILNEFMLIEIHNTMSHYPFTIGIIVVYFLLKELEINNLISILNLKYYDIM